MQIKQLSVYNLFGQFNHIIPFPLRSEDNPEPSLVLLCGENGVGKTRLLRMLHGYMNLDFTPFREVPFTSAQLTFSDDTTMSVKPAISKRKKTSTDCIRVKYGKHSVDLSQTEIGPLHKDDTLKVKAFREAFQEKTTDVTVNLIETGRLQQLYAEHEMRKRKKERPEYLFQVLGEEETVYYEDMPLRSPRQAVLLSERIQRFIRNAQLDYRRYFSSRTPDLFPRIIESLTEKSTSDYSSQNLVARIESVEKQHKITERYGLLQDPWNLDELKRVLLRTGESAPDTHALTVANTYLEFLESRASERSLLVERLQTFERNANTFLKGKSVSIHARHGLTITMEQGGDLSEAQLSSGEYHLLYLLVTALTTQRRGTVIAIDEPEISMHIGWQRRLLPAILECASMAQPQVVVATHSPEITVSYPESCVHLE